VYLPCNQALFLGGNPAERQRSHCNTLQHTATHTHLRELVYLLCHHAHFLGGTPVERQRFFFFLRGEVAFSGDLLLTLLTKDDTNDYYYYDTNDDYYYDTNDYYYYDTNDDYCYGTNDEYHYGPCQQCQLRQQLAR